ncbi:MAG: hypothetical protein ACFFD4_09935 [Candidatus Odinarchaeota archaeon]
MIDIISGNTNSNNQGKVIGAVIANERPTAGSSVRSKKSKNRVRNRFSLIVITVFLGA